MENKNSEILKEIDVTIDQLLENAKVLKEISHKKEFFEEQLALEKTQESLLAHLMHLDEQLKTKKPSSLSGEKVLLAKSVHQKLGRSGYLNKIILKKEQFEEKENPSNSKKPKIHKRKILLKKPR